LRLRWVVAGSAHQDRIVRHCIVRLRFEGVWTEQYAGHSSNARLAACRPPSFGAASWCMPAASTCPDTRLATACSGADTATRFCFWNSNSRKAPCFQRQRRRKRLSLRHGDIHTRIYAPERFFCVCAPSAPRAGNSHLPESLEPRAVASSIALPQS